MNIRKPSSWRVNRDPVQGNHRSFFPGKRVTLASLLLMTLCGAVSYAGEVIELECRGYEKPILSEDIIQGLEGELRQGNGLLVTFNETPGHDSMLLSHLLPTMGYNTLIPRGSRGGAGESLGIGRWDSTFFQEPVDFQLPYHWKVPPVPANERGIARYERFEQTAPYTDELLPEHNRFWTRPLENRDWQVRLWADDPYGSPLLTTGRFGPGRVAVWGSSLASLKAQPEVYEQVIAWLSDGQVYPTASQMPQVTAEVLNEARVLRVTLENASEETVQGEIVARFLTWEWAWVADALQAVRILPGNVAQIDLPFPESMPEQRYEALLSQDAWWVRVGFVPANGREPDADVLLYANLEPALEVGIATDNLYSLEAYPFASMGPHDGLLFDKRMGAEIMRYAYKPGETVHLTVKLSNALEDVAMLAQARDLTTPDNRSASGLNDGAIHSEKGPRKGFMAWSDWTGVAGKENRVSLTLPEARELTSVLLYLQPTSYRHLDDRNPAAVVVEVDGERVAEVTNLEQRAVSEYGSVEIDFPDGTIGREVTLSFPWTTERTPRGRARRAPAVGDVSLFAVRENTAETQTGQLIVTAREGLSGDFFELVSVESTIAPGESLEKSFEFKLPEDSHREQYWRIEATWNGEAVAEVPVLVSTGERALESLSTLYPSGEPTIGFIVTRGFRNVYDTGTGSQEMPNGWGNPDDLVWAYSHKMKQIGPGLKQTAGRLFVSDSDLRHYSTPWTSFPNGENFYEDAAPRLLEKAKEDRRWKESEQVTFSQSDRWDSSPDMSGMYTWMHLIEFDAWLREQGNPGLKGRTRSELVQEIDSRYLHQWQAWHLEKYLATLEMLVDTFAAEGKTFKLNSQGAPLLPMEATPLVSEVLQGMSDDSTWGIRNENIPQTTGRQAAVMAVNPSYRMSTLLQWGWNSALVNNPRWYSPVGTTEPSRRHYYHRAWRGVMDPTEGYRPMHAYGFNQNGYASWTMTPMDWQEWWRLLERHSLLSPDAPLGLGIVQSSAPFSDPDKAVFGFNGEFFEETIKPTQNVFQRLHEAGLGASFVANAAQIQDWPLDTPMVVVNPEDFSPVEAAALEAWVSNGGHVVAFCADEPLPPWLSSLFPADRQIAVRDKQALWSGQTLLVPLAAESIEATDMVSLAPALEAVLSPRVQFPEGVLGYSFQRSGHNYTVLEDWKEEPRTLAIRIQANVHMDGRLEAVALNHHEPLQYRREGGDWIVSVPMRPGDGEVVVWRECEGGTL